MPSTNPDSGIPIPLDPDPVRDGAKNIRDVVTFVPYYLIPGVPMFGVKTAGKPIAVIVQHQQTTSNQFGQLHVPFPKAMTFIAGASIQVLSGSGEAVIFDVDMSNPPSANGMIFRVWNPTTGVILPNRPVWYAATVIGQ